MRGRKRHLRSVGEMTVMPLKRPPDGRPSDCSCRTKGATRLLAAMRARRQSRGGPGGGNGLANREIWRARVARDDVRRALGCATPLRPRSDALSGRLETFAGGIPSESSPFVCAYPFEVGKRLDFVAAVGDEGAGSLWSRAWSPDRLYPTTGRPSVAPIRPPLWVCSQLSRARTSIF